MQQLQMIRDSPAYADRLADTLKQKLRLKTKVITKVSRPIYKEMVWSGPTVIMTPECSNDILLFIYLRNKLYSLIVSIKHTLCLG